MAIKKLCIRCKKVIEANQKYCVACLGKIKTDYNRDYDRYRRNRDSKDFYNSRAWKLKRQEIFLRYAHLDLYDLYVNNVITNADVIHHICELAEAPELALDNSNLIPLTTSNHTHIHELYKVDKAATVKLLQQLLEQWQHDTINS